MIIKKVVPESKLDLFRASFRELLEYCEIHRIQEPEWLITSKFGLLTNANKKNRHYNISVELAEIPPVKSYEFIAKIEHDKKRNLLFSKVGVIDRYLHNKLVCEHCKVNHFRNVTFILKNTETNKFIQVENSCINKFFECDLQVVINYINKISDFIDCDFERNSIKTKSRDFTYYLFDYVTCCVVSIKYFGFLPSKSGKDSTKNIALNSYHSPKVINVNEEYWNVCKISAKDCIKYYQNCEETSDFLVNAKTLVLKNFVKHSELGYIAEMVNSYLKIKRKEYEKKTLTDFQDTVPKTSEYVGELEKRYTGTVRLVNSFSFEARYCILHLLTFTDSEGNILKWFSSKSWVSVFESAEMDYTNYYQTGLFFEITGIVKKHEIYKNQKCTYLSRCKLKELKGENNRC